MDTFPDFVTHSDTDTARHHARREHTGWEAVIFQLDDLVSPEPGSELSTAAFAP